MSTTDLDYFEQHAVLENALMVARMSGDLDSEIQLVNEMNALYLFLKETDRQEALTLIERRMHRRCISLGDI